MIPPILTPFRRTALLAIALFVHLVPALSANSAETPGNPFRRFFGEWTLKDDSWTHNWGNGTEQIKIPLHHTLGRSINTDNSLLMVVDGPPPHGHILWAYDRATGDVQHLSSFGPFRIGTGRGRIEANGNVTLKTSFSDEAPGTYRIYTYRWISDDEYEMRSIQHDQSDKPTGLFYGGTFVRMRGAK